MVLVILTVLMIVFKIVKVFGVEQHMRMNVVYVMIIQIMTMQHVLIVQVFQMVIVY